VSFLLDTNAWIGLLRHNDPAIVTRIQQEDPAELFLCSVVVGELIYGAERSGSPHRDANLAKVNQLRATFISLPFHDQAAEEYGRLRAYLATAGLMIGPNDLMIASIALSNGLTLVTHNTSEFSRVPGLVIEDWQ
jgi:tRNA(fMet)-specific endonuclease VapC